MQFITNGPDVPDELLRAHGEKKVVFFCGAGVSYPAGLPGFKVLVERIYGLIGTVRNPSEEEAFGNNQYDATLDLLGRRIAGQHIAVKRALAEVLKPKLRRRHAADTHRALLQLSRVDDSVLRLVTTNFDRIFEHAAKTMGISLSTYAAPMLPVPKSSRWNGLVYLHGLLPAKPDDAAFQRLIVTSGDFGLAYLTERWAARFVSELFRNYVVCFVGYSINDPVLRYMMDALAADRLLGEVTPTAYAFADYPPGQEAAKKAIWEAKGVVPILYEDSDWKHAGLHGTLKAWAETHRDGVLGHERIIVNHALAHPSGSTRQDDFVGRVLWALAHKSGLPAKRFADLNPAPSLDWLEPLSDRRFAFSDLPRFGVSTGAETDDRLCFSLVSRPAPYSHAPWMQLVAVDAARTNLDEVILHLARWLLRHLNDPNLILWLVRYGAQLHPRFVHLIDAQLKRLALLQADGKAAELAEITAQAPNAIPGPLMLGLWRLLLTGRVKSERWMDIYGWRDRVKREGLTATLRLELRDLLAPKINLRRPHRTESEPLATATRLSQLVNWELVLTSDHIRSALQERDGFSLDDHLSELLPEFQQLLKDALDLLIELGEADFTSDSSYWHLPSIEEHWQNRGFHDWVLLIELLRDAWLSVRTRDQAKASRIAESWFDLPYLAFKRLALFAASQDGSVPGALWAAWLAENGAHWLWFTGSQREVMRLLVNQARGLDAENLSRLESLILAGPKRSLYRDDLEPASWDRLVSRSVWLRLAKLRQGGVSLGAEALARLTALSDGKPDPDFSLHQREEFPSWMSGSGDPDYEELREVDIAPARRHELVEWLKLVPKTRYPFVEDTWRETCRNRFGLSLTALCQLAAQDQWPHDRWVVALQVWAEESHVVRSWRRAANLVLAMPTHVLQELSHNVSWWVAEVAKSASVREQTLFDLCGRILDLAYPEEPDTNDPVGRAINHPVGHVANALFSRWFRRAPGDGDGLPADIERPLTRLCDRTVPAFRNGRVILASNLIALFRVDRAWTQAQLLPMFRWGGSAAEAAALWQGFLWAPRLYHDLMLAFKQNFLDAAQHYAALGDHADQYATFLTYAALDRHDGYSPADFSSAVAALPVDGLHTVARALSQAQEGAGEQREEYWAGRVKPFLHDVWPKDHGLRSPAISDSLSRMSIATGGRFPEALHAIESWLMPLEHPGYVVHQLHRAELCSRFPSQALSLLDAILNDQQFAPTELADCLGALIAAAPPLKTDTRYQRLAEYSRRRAI